MSGPAQPERDANAALAPRQSVGQLIKQVYASLIRRIDQRMQPLELTAMQWEPMLLVHFGKADTVAALARESHVNCGAMTLMLDRLEEKQLLRRRRSDEDRRVVHLELTEKGRKVADEIMPLIREELNVHLRDFTPEEVATLVGLLERMLRNAAQEE